MGKITGKSQKGQAVPNFTEEEARAYIEKMMWPNGEPTCRHCGSVNAYRMQGETVRPGLCRCRDCDKQFTVTVGTVMEDSHLPLSVWVKAIHLMASSKKGMSALQLQRNLGLGSYRTAWHLAHRVRLAMKCEPMAGDLRGIVEADETYVGGKPRPGSGQPRKKGRGTTKAPVMVLVERGGKAHCQPLQKVDGASIREAMQCMSPYAKLYTDELPVYRHVAPMFSEHQTVNHGQGQYVTTGDIHTNTAESFFALLKRGVYGTFHHVSKKHLHRYCDEFAFRWNGREVTDSERRNMAVQGAEGKRLMYKTPIMPSEVTEN